MPDVDDASGPGHRRRALEDDEQLTAEAALAQNHLARLDVEAFGDPRHLAQLLFRTGVKPRDPLQTVGLGRRPTVCLCVHPCLSGSMPVADQIHRTRSG